MHPRPSFNVVIEKAEVEDFEAAADTFARAFSLDPEHTRSLLRSVPVLFLSKATKREVKALLPTLEELSKNGFEFRITTKEVHVPRVHWLARPNFAAAEADGNRRIAFEWDNLAFVCPSCGETFVFKHVGKPPLKDAAAEVAAQMESIRPKTDAGAGAPKVETPQVKTRETQPSRPEPELQENVELQLEEPSEPPRQEAPLPEPLPPEPLPEEPAAEQSAAEAEAPDLLAEEAPSEGGEAFGETDDVIPLEDLPPVETGPEVPSPQAGRQPPPAVEPEPPTADAIQAGPAPAGGQASPEDGELYNVFIPEVKDAKKRQQVIKIITEVRQCSPEEALKLTRRVMIPVAKKIPRERAEDLLARFRKLKITGRMTRAKG